MGVLRDTFGSDRYAIESTLAVEAIVQRAQALGASGWFRGGIPWGPEVRGRASRRRIVMTRRAVVNNGYRPYLFARMSPAAVGTRLDVVIRPTRVIALFTLIATVGLAALVIGQSIASSNPVVLSALVIPAVMAAVVPLSHRMVVRDRALLRSVITAIASADGERR